MDIFQETRLRLAQAEDERVGYTTEITASLEKQQATYLDRQIQWRQELIATYQSDIVELEKKKSLLSDAAREHALIDGMGPAPVVPATPATMRRKPRKPATPKEG